jgi:hypothetical protein
MRQHHHALLRLAAFSLVAVLGCSASAFAQFSQGRLTGVVRDDTGAALPQTRIRVVDQQTGVSLALVTDEAGRYDVPALRPSLYTVEAGAPGFIQIVRRDVLINAGTSLALDFDLKVAKVAETVEVRGETPLVNTVQSQVAEVIQQPLIQSLPLNGRNFLELAFLVPGNAPTANYDPTKARVVEVSSAGQLGRGGNVSVDGVDNNDDVVGGVLQNFSVDAVQEFQVVTNRYSAEVGRSASSVINVVTRSGTNALHGSGSVFHRSADLTAKNPLVERTGDFDRQQYSGAAGGPLQRDRSHWFFSYERTQEDGAEIAGRRNLAARTVESFFTPAPFRDNLLLGRVDLSLGPDDRVFVRYGRQWNKQTNQGTLRAPLGDVSNLQIADNRMDSVVAGWTRVVRRNLVNSFRVHYSDFKNEIVPAPAYDRSLATELQFPSILAGPTFRAPQQTVLKRLQFKDDVNWVSGAHGVRFGVDFHPKIEWSAIFDLFGSGTIILTEDFASTDRDGNGQLDDFDIPVAAVIKNQAPSPPLVLPPDNRYLALYAQDDWRVRDNLTVNAGLRWEMDFNVNGIDVVNQFEPGERRREKDNFSPRIGVTWDPLGNGRQTIRGGYGIYYDRIILEVSLLELLLDGRTLPVAVIEPANLQDAINLIGPSGSIPIGINVLDNNLETPYNHQVTLGFERQLGRDYVVSADGVLNYGRKYIVGVEVNRPRVNEPFRNPAIQDSVVELTNAARTEYRGLLVAFKKRMNQRFSFLASYTLSESKNHSNDDQIPFAAVPFDDPLDIDRDFSWAAIDERHRFVLSGTVEAPWGFRISPLITLSSGLPFDIRQNTDFVGDGAADRFPLLPRNSGGRRVKSGADLNRLIEQFNTAPEFAALRELRGSGYAPVDDSLDFTNPFRSVDVRVAKQVRLGATRIELLAEVFNLFNSLNIRGFFLGSYAGVGNNLDSLDTFGQPLSTAGGAFGSGGPRALQIGAKMIF